MEIHNAGEILMIASRNIMNGASTSPLVKSATRLATLASFIPILLASLELINLIDLKLSSVGERLIGINQNCMSYNDCKGEIVEPRRNASRGISRSKRQTFGSEGHCSMLFVK